MYAQTPLTIGQVLDQGFHAYGATLRHVWPLSLGAGLAPTLPGLTLQLVGEVEGVGAIAAVVMSLLVTVVMSVFLSVVLLLRMDALIRADIPPLTITFQQASKRFIPMLLASLLYMLAIIVGLVLLLVPGLILMISLWPFQAAVALDGNRPMQALQRSHRLVWGNWWRTATILSIPGIVLLALYAMIGMVAGVVLMLSGPGTASPALLTLVELLVKGLAGALLTPLFYAISLVLFHDLKLRKEGTDLAARITALSA